MNPPRCCISTTHPYPLSYPARTTTPSPAAYTAAPNAAAISIPACIRLSSYRGCTRIPNPELMRYGQLRPSNGNNNGYAVISSGPTFRLSMTCCICRGVRTRHISESILCWRDNGTGLWAHSDPDNPRQYRTIADNNLILNEFEDKYRNLPLFLSPECSA